MSIAGHNFQDGPGGSRCVNIRATDGCVCGKTWGWVMTAQQEDVGQDVIDHEGYACCGRLSQPEFNEIDAEKKRVWSAVAETGGA